MDYFGNVDCEDEIVNSYRFILLDEREKVDGMSSVTNSLRNQDNLKKKKKLQK